MPADEVTEMPADEEALMEAHSRGDEASFDRLFRSLAPSVHGFFLRKYGDAALADDLLQTTFLKVHRARKDYRIGAPVRPWVFTIAARVGLDEMRRRGRRPEETEPKTVARAVDAAGGEQPDPEALVGRGKVAAQVRDALRGLPESQRAVIELHRYQQRTFKEIAELLGTTEGAAKLRAFRVYERLRTELAPLRAELQGRPVEPANCPAAAN